MDGARLTIPIAHGWALAPARHLGLGLEVFALGHSPRTALRPRAVLVSTPALAKALAASAASAPAPLEAALPHAQLVAMLEQGRWLRYAAHANAMADRLAAGLQALAGFGSSSVEAKQLFVALPEPWIRALHGGLRLSSLAGPLASPACDPLGRELRYQPDDVDALIAAAGRPGLGLG